MATWKERGFVPDSEDDEELDSQSDSGANQRYGGDLGKSPREPEDNGGQIDIELPRAEPNFRDNGCPTVLLSEKAVSKHNTDSHPSSLHSSPQPLFKDPRTMFDLDDTDGSQSLPNISGSQPNFDITAADDISPSYVRLTSPLSSPPSSPVESQLSNPTRETFENPNRPKIHLVGPTIRSSPPIEDLLPACDQPMHHSVRTLRQRNAIQLHPYILEQERYRRTLKSHGMTPMRLAQASEEHSRRSRYISERPESQGFGTAESQLMDIDSNYVMPPSSQGTTHERLGDESHGGESHGDESHGDESHGDESHGDERHSDEEFPDINELLRNQQSLNRQSEFRRQRKQYSSKFNRRQLSKARSQLSQSIHRVSSEGDIFDVPASPPHTSLPLPTVTRDTRGSSSSARSHSPSAFEEDEFPSHRAADLLTPATSVIKPVSDPVLIDLVSDKDDPFASELSSSLSSSSDESIEIRKVSKRFRGVLPASHLRLNHQVKIPRSAGHTQRQYDISTSEREPARRGIAFPKAKRGSSAGSPTINHSMPFFSEDSDEGDDGVSTTGLIMEDNDSMIPGSFSQQCSGFAEEDDRVDAMLPSRKRRERRPGTQPRKRLRVGAPSIQQYGMQTHQLHISEHLSTSRNQGPSQSRKSRYSEEAPRRSRGVTYRTRNIPAPPRLGILDVLGIDGQDQNEIPQFIRVAARAARSKKNYGRQSPSKKFIRLASRNDTCDAQSVLQNWKDGNIKPRDLGHISGERSATSRIPLNPISNNKQRAFRPPQETFKSPSQILRHGERYNPQPRKFSILKAKQTSMSDFVTSKPSYRGLGQRAAKESLPTIQKRQQKQQFYAPRQWQAQLESTEAEFSHRHPTTSFDWKKKALDNLYRVARKRQAPESNLQLSRFLANSGTPESTVDNESLLRDSESIVSAAVPTKRLSKPRKRLPQRMDVGAAAYRQPSEPLVLEFLAPVEARDHHGEGNRLQGLGKFGTHYTNHFDIFPLQSGIFFHESTFIGSGRLLEVLRGPSPNSFETSRTPISYHIGEKTFKWGRWNEDVSSEVGVCFDWILDHLNQQPLPTMTPSTRDQAVGAATFVVDYVQHHLSFIDLQQQDVMFSRTVVVVSEALGRLELKEDVLDEPQLQSRIEVISMWAVLVMQLLQISRSQSSHSSTTTKLEELLVATTRHCIGFLLCKGFEGIRKLYDDLQYLSFRTHGIKKNHYAVHAWVIMIKILEAARIPGGSFWDVANTPLLDSNAIHLNDARSMEKMWYSIFTILPLCEFDESGVVITGQRQTASFDNWFLPLKMLKGVFTLYSSGSRQPPSFNDYFRALLQRCHYLIVEWGWWKCNKVIGAIFDFFASQNIRNLRNEEVYKSPQFLEELDTESSLAVEPDDRGFHIFLKIVALTIKHMHQADEGKNIRNLVFRLLPNHNREYPKEKTLDTRDLASLRNHHDLLCTLYWAAPPEHGPSLTLIQELVAPDRSHNAVCLINLRSWQQLARFTFTRCTSAEAFQPLITWQETFWFKLVDQFLKEDSNTRKQAALLTGQLITETALQQTIANNKASTMLLMRSSLNAISSAINYSASSAAAMAAFNTRIIKSVFNMKDSKSSDSTRPLIADTIGILTSYIKQIEKLHPRLEVPPQIGAPMSEDDSQDSMDIGLNLDRQMMIFPLSEEIQPCLGKLARQILEGRLYQSKEPLFMQATIEIWTQLICLATEESNELREFLPGRRGAIFQRRHGCERANKYWPLFLGELLRYKTFAELEDAGFDIGLEWVLALTIPLAEPDHLSRLTLSMFEKKHPLLKPFPNMAAVLRSPCLATGWLSRHLIQGAIDVMRESSQSSTKVPSWSATTTDMPLKRDFSFLLKNVLYSMEHQLKVMGPGSPQHIQYMVFCQGVAEDIRSRGSEIIPLSDFFIMSSIYYWPPEEDPKLFAAGVVAYSLRLDEKAERTSSELFHYLHRGWRSDFIHGRLKNHVGYIKKGLKHWSFIEFMLTDFVPAALHVGFDSDFGWILCSTYLPPLANRISKLLGKSDSKARAIFGHLATILEIIMNGCMQLYSRWQKTIKGIHPSHRGIVSVACQFWLALLPMVKGYVDRYPDDAVLIDGVNNTLITFARETVWAFSGASGDGWEVPPFDIIEGRRVKVAVGVMMTDCDKNWTLNQTIEAAMQSKSGMLTVDGYGAREPNKPVVDLGQLWPSTLREVLETGQPHFEIGFPHPIPINLRTATTNSRRFGWF